MTSASTILTSRSQVFAGGVPDVDSDGDGVLNCEEECDLNPDKTLPGVCGCNEPDVDSDGDGVLDCNDGCPTDSSKVGAGQCGCELADTADCVQPCICDWEAETAE